MLLYHSHPYLFSVCRFFEKEPKNGAFLGQDKEFGPEFIDFAQEDPRDAFTDDNDCAAVFPDTTDVVQIIYQAGVREKNLTDIDGSAPLSPVGGTASAERANLMYSVGTSNVDGCAPYPHSHACCGYSRLCVNVCTETRLPELAHSRALSCIRFLSGRSLGVAGCFQLKFNIVCCHGFDMDVRTPAFYPNAYNHHYRSDARDSVARQAQQLQD